VGYRREGVEVQYNKNKKNDYCSRLFHEMAPLVINCDEIERKLQTIFQYDTGYTSCVSSCPYTDRNPQPGKRDFLIDIGLAK
jgi:hypothetical protein